MDFGHWSWGIGGGWGSGLAQTVAVERGQGTVAGERGAGALPGAAWRACRVAKEPGSEAPFLVNTDWLDFRKGTVPLLLWARIANCVLGTSSAPCPGGTVAAGGRDCGFSTDVVDRFYKTEFSSTPGCEGGCGWVLVQPGGTTSC